MHLKRIQGSINEDNGLSLAFTIAHELGHRLIKNQQLFTSMKIFYPIGFIFSLIFYYQMVCYISSLVLQ